MIAELKALLPQQPRASLDLAVVFSGLGNRENSLAWLAKAEQMHVGDLIGIGQHSHFANLGSDPRFQRRAERVRAPK